MIVSAATLPILQVHFQVGVSGHKGHKLRHQLFSQRCTSKIGMQNHARCIDHTLHPLLILPGQNLPHFYKKMTLKHTGTLDILFLKLFIM